ncbi:MAG: pitrilysin family protein [Candidatus Acidiferrales bacterium]|jgi:predicted Zn-dependent peptidase
MIDTTRNIEKTTLANGLVVISEQMPHVRSVALGIWLLHGSRREPGELNGISHFIEHMVFKGTERRSAEDIAREADRIGGMLDAFTSKEQVCFNTRIIDEHLPAAFDILADLVLEPKFAEEEITREKSVILEEIKMALDNPEDLVHELFSENFWYKQALGKPILGTAETVGGFDRSKLRDWFGRWYAPNHIVITAAGNLTHAQLLDLVGSRFRDRKPSPNGHPETAPSPEPRITLRAKRELEQVHLCLGVAAFPMADKRRFAASLLNSLLGGGMSSRLFQNIREKQGLAYSIFSEMNPYRDTGMLSVYSATAADKTSGLIQSVLAEFRSLKEQLVSEEELRRAKDHLKGALLLSLESTGSRMGHIARHYLYFGRFFSIDEMISQLESVTREDIQNVAQEFFRPGRIAATVLGPIDDFKLTPADLAC